MEQSSSDYVFGSEPRRICRDREFSVAYLNDQIIFRKNEKIDQDLFYFLIDLPRAHEIFDVIVEPRPSESMLEIMIPCDCCGSGPHAAVKFMDFRQRLGLMQKLWHYHSVKENENEPINIGIGHVCSDCIGVEKCEIYREEDSQWVVPNNNFGKITTSMFSELLQHCENKKWEGRLIERLAVLDYQEFLKTPYWRVVSFFVKSRYKWMCANCRSRNSLAVHHKSYKNHGMEHRFWDTDLVCLCSSCHSKEHSK